MNRKVRYCFAAVALLVLTGCTAFRINMGPKYGPHAPPSPVPSGMAKEWFDVEKWQLFLVEKRFLAPGTFTANVFGPSTVEATKNFQAALGDIPATAYALPKTGCVNYATYHKAVQEGMPHYKPVKGPDACPMITMGNKYGMAVRPLTVGDPFRMNLHYGCSDSGGWFDVLDWQNFLVNNAYLTSGTYTPGQFDNINTQSATTAFQMAYCPLAKPGYVDSATWAYANNFFSNTGGMCVSLVSHGSTTLATTASTTTCGH